MKGYAPTSLKKICILFCGVTLWKGSDEADVFQFKKMFLKQYIHRL